MGGGGKNWFVCIFARDNAYGNFQAQAEIGPANYCRNTDIDTLELAAKYIIDKGGYVIRLGKKVEKEMSFKHPMLIDYPFTKWRSGFMDMYLQSKAKFVLSSPGSGATDTVTLFGTPYCVVNHILNCRETYQHSIGLPQKYKLKDRFVGLREFIKIANTYTNNKKFYMRSGFLEDVGFVTVYNTKEEILAITQEMYERLEGTFVETQKDKELQEELDRLYLTLNNRVDTTDLKFMRIGAQFLRDNPWYLNT